MSWKLILAGAALGLIVLAYAAPGFTHAAIVISAIVGVVAAASFGVIWTVGGAAMGKPIPIIIGAGLLLIWIAAMALGPIERGPLDCGGPTAAGYVC